MMESQSVLSNFLLFAGGLAVFLLGMKSLSAGLRKASSGRVAHLLSTITGNPVSALLSGVAATVAVQSSSMVMLTLIGLVQSQILTFSQSLGVVLGAEIGTTMMAQLIAFSPGEFGLPLFALGFFLSLIRRQRVLSLFGEAISGLGLLFFGLKLMGMAVEPLQSSPQFLSILTTLDNPLLCVLAGAVMTAIIQSSGAFIAILITMAQQGVLTLEVAVPLMFGANIGTCITAAIGSAGSVRPARRVFLAQLMFNVTYVIVFLIFLPPWLDLIRAISPSDAAGGLARQIANAHTFSNLFMALLFLPFLPQFGRMLVKLLPDDPDEMGRIPAVWHLRTSALATPEVAVGLARLEISRMNKILGRMASALPVPFIGGGNGRDLIYKRLGVSEGLMMREEKLDFLEQKVTAYLIRVMQEAVGEPLIREAAALMALAKEIESAGDVVETLLADFPSGKLNVGLTAEGKAEIERLHEQVCREIAAMNLAIEEMSPRRASAVIEEGKAFDRIFFDLGFSHMRRIKSRSESERTHDLHMELLRALDVLHHQAMSMARTIVGMTADRNA
ncbi:MAG TPA: Na/Pi cotransporter family protein [Chlorobaculum sp.]|uniref:Transporter, putative n=1 Tax=Chlorobaculum tepidum (strain ATCC 49652 / DSM 12025 / NBRC 103806 / TLS) TaxID=194439 RepID=Q8KDW0_CHLTE|nr:Na/Pi cotransporter family protein [Chlorobaculum tepidum]AAM72169.1 transporter, putative [Chlorobaculum tepidum TLS]HBU23103.1 Na/Pi cotransporter family protein [Chlorobaculum sp.]